MKSVLKVAVVEEDTFPVLCKSVEVDVTVMFNNPTCGTVVQSAESDISVGKYRDNWFEWDNKFHWTVLPKGSTVTLTQ